MVTTPTFLPTRRELFLVLSLLFILLCVSQGGYIYSTSLFSLSRSSFSVSKFTLVLDSERRPRQDLESGTYPDLRLTWHKENVLPETSLIQHVPGASLKRSHSYSYSLGLGMTRLYPRVERVRKRLRL